MGLLVDPNGNVQQLFSVNANPASPNTTQIVNQAQPVITWNPVPTNITYGTTLVAGQLNATAASTYFATVPGNFNYNPGVGAGLGVAL